MSVGNEPEHTGEPAESHSSARKGRSEVKDPADPSAYDSSRPEGWSETSEVEPGPEDDVL